MATLNFLAIDLGAESGRTVVGRFDGARLELAETHRFPNEPVQVLDTLFWDPLGLWQHIKRGIAESVKAAGPPASIGVDTWGVDFALIGRDGALAGNPVHYRDRRTDGMLEFAFQRVPRHDLYRVTGLQFMQFNTLYQLLAIACRAHGDPFAGVDKLLFMPDLFNYFLTGAKATEYTIASTSQMLDAHTREWSQPLLEAFGVPLEILPDECRTGTRLGRLLESVARATGAGSAEVRMTASHDTAAAIAAVPAEGDDWCYISSGTWSLMGAEVEEPIIADESLAANFTNEGGVGGSIRFLKNVMGLWLVQQCRRSFERAGRSYDYAVLTEHAAAARPFGPVIDPDDYAFLNPDDMPTAIVNYCTTTGQAVPADDGAVIRCCLESLALRYRWVLETMERMLGKTIRTIHIVGGGSQNELLCQMTADCCKRLVVTGPVEATAAGNCLVQGLGHGTLGSLADIRAVVRSSFTLRHYEPKPDSRWDESYARFQRLGD